MEHIDLDLDQVDDASSSDDSISGDMYDPQDYGYKLTTSHCGKYITYYTWHAPLINNILHENVTYDMYRSMLSQIVILYGNRLRNIVLTIRYMYNRSFISITRDRLLSVGDDMVEAFDVILDNLIQCNYKEVYESYDTNYDVFNRKYVDEHIDMTMFSLDTSQFAIAVMSDPSGGMKINMLFYEHLVVIEPPNMYGSNNCLFNCVTYVVNKYIDVDAIRRLKRFSDNKYIKLKHIGILEKVMGISINVYGDNVDVDGKPVVIYSSVIGACATVNLVLHDRHYAVFHDIKYHHDSIMVVLRTSTYIFYDMETYFDPHDNYHVQVYCFSYIIISNGTIDRKGCVLKTSITDSIEHDIAEIILPYTDSGNTKIIGFNNGAFDDYILIDILCTYNRHLTKVVFDKRNRIVSFLYNKIYSKDVYRFILTSLHNATTSFNCNNQKLLLDHSVIQRAIESDTYNSLMSDDMIRKIRDYAMMDVLSLKDLYFRLVNTFSSINKNFDMDDPNITTLPQMSMRGFRRYIYEKYRGSMHVPKLPVINDISMDRTLRQALIGGRCQVFEKGEHHDISIVDVCSLYPYVMSNNLYPLCVYNKLHNMEDFMREVHGYAGNGKDGIYYVTVLSQPLDKIVPYTNSDGTHNWDYDGEISRWVTSVTLRLLFKYRCDVSVHYGYVLDVSMDYIFKDFLHPIIVMKEEQDMYRSCGDSKYNPALRECLKLIMNSLSGKLLQLPTTDDKILTTSPSYCDEMVQRYRSNIDVQLIRNKLWLLNGKRQDNDVVIKSPVVVGMMILDYAKEYMYNVITKVRNKYYMDTDSLILDKQELCLLNNIIGNKCGMLKVELDNMRTYHVVVAAKKCYCVYYIDNGREVIYDKWFKIRGVNTRGSEINHDKIVPDGDVAHVSSLIKANNNAGLSIIFTQYNSARSLDLMRNIMRNNVSYVLCMQIFRDLRNDVSSNSMSIRAKYILKRLPMDINNSI